MIDRIVGGVVWIALIFVAYISGLYCFLNLLLLVIGLHEIYKMNKLKPTKFAYIYSIVFLTGIMALNYIYVTNDKILLLLITSIMLCDTFAYLTGKAIGKHKFSKTSPNKTIEGIIGGMAVSISFVMILVLRVPYFSNIMSFSNIGVIILFVLILIAGIYGDLLESKLKRITGQKDSGTIIYGHGGVCDRIDSWVLAAMPMALVLLILS